MNDHICSGYRYEVIVVEDNSPDGTYEVKPNVKLGDKKEEKERVRKSKLIKSLQESLLEL